MSRDQVVRQILIEEFNRLKASNSRYSKRAFSLKLGISQSTLIRVLNGKRSLPKKHIQEIPHRLKLSKARANRLLRAVASVDSTELEQKIRQPDVLLDNQSEIDNQIHSGWIHYAVLTILEIDSLWTIEAISERLNVSRDEIRDALGVLAKRGLVSRELNHWKLVSSNGVCTSEDVPCSAIVQGHLRELEIAANAVVRFPTESRDFSSRYIAIDTKRLPEAKRLIRKFRQEISDLLEDGNKSEVYLLGVQLFPLTATRTSSIFVGGSNVSD